VMKDAEIQSVVSDIQRFKNATSLFKEKYGSLPGDMPNAESYWGSSASCSPATYSDTEIPTCNGNGDGFIGGSDGTGISIGTSYNESSRYWQQLANAGLIDGAYNGTFSTDNLGNMPGVNIPKSKLNGNGITLHYVSTPATASSLFLGEYFHSYIIGKVISTSLNVPAYDVGMSAEEAYAIDLKMDDGKAAFGMVLSYRINPYGATCNTSTTAVSANYNVSTAGMICSLIIKSGF
jgi:hypothetical protein